MQKTDLYGNALKNDPKPAAAHDKPTPSKRERRETKEQRRKDKKTTAYVEHFIPTPAPEEEHWRHAHWKDKRATVQKTIASTFFSNRTQEAFRSCGAGAFTQWSPSLGKRRLSAFYCHNRHCEPCARAKANKIARNLQEKLDKAEKLEYRLITLTQLHNDDPLVDQIKTLYANFRKLRSTKLWKETQRGGAAILEVKHNGYHWHPHLHIVASGTYLDKFELSEKWKQITTNSFIVDIRSIHRTKDAAHYVAKYITKSTSDNVWRNEDLAQEWVTASKSLRTAGTFGTWRKYPLCANNAQATDWQFEDTLSNILKRARKGDEVAAAILLDLRPPGKLGEVSIAAARAAAAMCEYLPEENDATTPPDTPDPPDR